MSGGEALRQGFIALSHRNYRLFWFGQVASLVGTWMQSVAQSWLILELTDSSFQVGLVVALQFGPVLLLGLGGGAIADRFDKRRLLIATQCGAALQALTLGLLTLSGAISPPLVWILAALLGTVNALDIPTRQSFVTEMVGREHVMNAIALNSSAFNLARIIGPAIGGLLIARFGVAAAFLANSVSFAAVVLGLLAMREDELTQRPSASCREPFWRGIGAGLAYARRTPVVLVAILLVGAVATFGMNFNVILPGMARDLFRIGSEGFGLLMSAIGIGALLAALFLAFRPRFSPVRMMLAGAAGFTLLEALFAASPWFPTVKLAFPVLVGVGFSQICLTAPANTSLQRQVPNELRGRVMSIYVTIFAGSMPVGGLFAGYLARNFGAPVALAVGAALSGAAVVWAGWRLRRGR